MAKLKLALRLALYTLVLVVGTTIIHESSHFIAGLVTGVPISEMRIGFFGINPGVHIQNMSHSSNLSLIRYSGGFVTAVLIGVFYALYWYRQFSVKPTFENWVMGLLTIEFAGLDLVTGYLEGRFNAAYLYYSQTPFNPLMFIYLWMMVVLGVAHQLLCPLQKTGVVRRRKK